MTEIPNIRQPIQVTAVVLVLCALVSAFILSSYRQSLLSDAKELARTELTVRGNAVVIAIQRRVLGVEGLAAFVEAVIDHPDENAQIEFYLQSLFPRMPGIRSLAVTPDKGAVFGIPGALTENIAQDVLLQTDKARVFADSERARLTGNLIISSPVNFVDGSKGLVIRKAVFQDGEDWGFVSLTSEFTSIFAGSDILDQNESNDFLVTNGIGEFIVGDVSVLDRDPIFISIEVENINWNLYVVPQNGWDAVIAPQIRLFGLISIILGVGFSMTAYSIARRQNQLAIQVEERTEQARTAGSFERQRLARELHDSVSQAVYAIGLAAQTLKRSLGEGNQNESVNYIIELTEGALAELRAIILGLRPESLEKEGLTGGITNLSNMIRARHHIEVDLKLCPEPSITEEARLAVYRVAQEAVQNSIKHASAQSIALHLAQEEGHLILDVKDDGVGFDLGADFPGHVGLVSMRERVQILGGELRIESQPGQGTEIHLRLPL